METNEAQDIADDITEKSGLGERVIVRALQDAYSPSLRQVSDGTIAVEVEHASQVRQLVGRYAVRKKWPSYKWFIADRPNLVVLTGFVAIVAISIIHLLLGRALPQYSLAFSIVTDVGIGGILVGFSYALAIRHPRWRRELVEELSKLGGLTEFDDDRYEVTKSPAQIAWPFLAFVAFMLLILRPAVLTLDFNSYPPIIFFLALLVSIPSFFIAQYKALDHNPCWDEIGNDDGELLELTRQEKETAEKLKALIAAEIAALELHDLFEEDTGCTADDLRVVFRESRFPQCRWFTFYEEDSRLTFEIHDMGAEEAKRLTVAKLRRLATPMFSQVSLRRRLLVVFNLIFLLGYILIVAVIGATLGEHLVHIFLILGGIVLGYTTRLNIVLHRESQQALRKLLKESDHMTDFHWGYYYETALGGAIRIDVAMFVAYVLAAIGIEFLVLWVL